jgi:hypothetical protein
VVEIACGAQPMAASATTAAKIEPRANMQFTFDPVFFVTKPRHQPAADCA